MTRYFVFLVRLTYVIFLLLLISGCCVTKKCTWHETHRTKVIDSRVQINKSKVTQTEFLPIVVRRLPTEENDIIELELWWMADFRYDYEVKAHEERHMEKHNIPFLRNITEFTDKGIAGVLLIPVALPYIAAGMIVDGIEAIEDITGKDLGQTYNSAKVIESKTEPLYYTLTWQENQILSERVLAKDQFLQARIEPTGSIVTLTPSSDGVYRFKTGTIDEFSLLDIWHVSSRQHVRLDRQKVWREETIHTYSDSRSTLQAVATIYDFAGKVHLIRQVVLGRTNAAGFVVSLVIDALTGKIIDRAIDLATAQTIPRKAFVGYRWTMIQDRTLPVP